MSKDILTGLFLGLKCVITDNPSAMSIVEKIEEILFPPSDTQAQAKSSLSDYSNSPENKNITPNNLPPTTTGKERISHLNPQEAIQKYKEFLKPETKKLHDIFIDDNWFICLYSLKEESNVVLMLKKVNTNILIYKIINSEIKAQHEITIEKLLTTIDKHSNVKFSIPIYIESIHFILTISRYKKLADFLKTIPLETQNEKENKIIISNTTNKSSDQPEIKVTKQISNQDWPPYIDNPHKDINHFVFILSTFEFEKTKQYSILLKDREKSFDQILIEFNPKQFTDLINNILAYKNNQKKIVTQEYTIDDGKLCIKESQFQITFDFINALNAFYNKIKYNFKVSNAEPSFKNPNLREILTPEGPGQNFDQPGNNSDKSSPEKNFLNKCKELSRGIKPDIEDFLENRFFGLYNFPKLGGVYFNIAPAPPQVNERIRFIHKFIFYNVLKELIDQIEPNHNFKDNSHPVLKVQRNAIFFKNNCIMTIFHDNIRFKDHEIVLLTLDSPRFSVLKKILEQS